MFIDLQMSKVNSLNLGRLFSTVNIARCLLLLSFIYVGVYFELK